VEAAADLRVETSVDRVEKSADFYMEAAADLRVEEAADRRVEEAADRRVEEAVDHQKPPTVAKSSALSLCKLPSTFMVNFPLSCYFVKSISFLKHAFIRH